MPKISITKLKSLKHLSIIDVTWTDANGADMGWEPLDAFDEPTLTVCHSAGFFHRATEDSVTVLQSTTDDGSFTGYITIPKVNITQIVHLT